MLRKLAATLSPHATTLLARFRQADGDRLPAVFDLAVPAAPAASRTAAFVAMHLAPYLITGAAGISAFPSLGHAISSNSFVSRCACAPPNNRCRCNKLLNRLPEQLNRTSAPHRAAPPSLRARLSPPGSAAAPGDHGPARR